MKRFIFFLIFSWAVHLANGQEKVVPDSIVVIPEPTEAKELNLKLPSFTDGSSLDGKINLFNQTLFSQPLLPDFNQILDFKKYFNSNSLSTESFSTYRFGISPFYPNEIISNHAEYKINNKFLFGGNSFGAQSIFDRQGINPSVQNMSTKGASMFMQYKVSKNFKIETRVSVTNHESPWGP